MLSRRFLRVGVAASAVAASFLVPLTTSAAVSATPPNEDYVAVDRAANAGLRVAEATTWSAATGDYNGDGAEDVLINFHIGKVTKLMRNRGAGHYRRAARHAWPALNSDRRPIDRHNCAWADVDRNGRQDVYCSTGRTNLNYVKRERDNELWLQNRRGRFREVGTRWGVGDVCGRGRNVAFLDANGDRWPDLFVGNHTPRDVKDECDRSRELPNEGSKIFLNIRGEKFREARYFRHGSGPGARCAEVLDFNGDGWDDLFTCRDENVTPRLYRNRQGRGFVDVTDRNNLTRRLTDGTVADLDHDGDPDLVTSGYGAFTYHINQNGHFLPAVVIDRPEVGTGWGVAVGDADGDGDQDVYGMVSQGLQRNPDDAVFLNDSLAFTSVLVPAAGGAADDVIALDPRGDGRAAFLVLNGRKRLASGPVQLVRVVRG